MACIDELETSHLRYTQSVVVFKSVEVFLPESGKVNKSGKLRNAKTLLHAHLYLPAGLRLQIGVRENRDATHGSADVLFCDGGISIPLSLGKTEK